MPRATHSMRSSTAIPAAMCELVQHPVWSTATLLACLSALFLCSLLSALPTTWSAERLPTACNEMLNERSRAGSQTLRSQPRPPKASNCSSHPWKSNCSPFCTVQHKLIKHSTSDALGSPSRAGLAKSPQRIERPGFNNGKVAAGHAGELNLQT